MLLSKNDVPLRFGYEEVSQILCSGSDVTSIQKNWHILDNLVNKGYTMSIKHGANQPYRGNTMRKFLSIAICALTLLGTAGTQAQESDAKIVSRRITVHPDQPKQTIWGLGFEIQSDSIGSGNRGLPKEPIAVPHDLVPSERERLAREMLAGFRYCRLAGGLYWRGLCEEKKQLRPRWPEQLEELRELLDTAKVEGLSFEYWSPAPYWKGNRAFSGPSRATNRLRCFSRGWENDTEYQGDTERFLHDFGNAVVNDIKTLEEAGLKVSMWGLQNEPYVGHNLYPTCLYHIPQAFVRAYRVVAGAIRQHDPTILLFADTEKSFPNKIVTGMHDPEVAALVDAYVVHTIGAPSENVRQVHARITNSKRLPRRPWFQNEYEYLTGGATPDRCLNTVQHIMNSFQLAENPTWFWLHALKPLKNAEASGYSLGFWNSLIEPAVLSDGKLRRWPEGPAFLDLPESLAALEAASVKRITPNAVGTHYAFVVNQPVKVHLLVEQCGDPQLDEKWEKTDRVVTWEGGSDVVYQREFPSGTIEIPAHRGRDGKRNAASHLAFVEGSDPVTLEVGVGVNMPVEIHSKALELERKAASIKPGHWVFNPYNWHAVGSFAKRMPWDSVALNVTEDAYDPEGRILAYRRPDGKLSVVLSNRSTTEEKSFVVSTGLGDAMWKGFRYTPDEGGPGTLGVEIGTQQGGELTPTLPVQSWEFWEQQ
jgi:hypothetical protein